MWKGRAQSELVLRPFFIITIILQMRGKDMYYKLMKDVLFRKYDGYGLITDNSEYGYRMLNDIRTIRGERYVSESGAEMLARLGKKPKEIDDIVSELENVFVGVDFATLKKDTIEFLQYFVDEGFLAIGDNIQNCKDCNNKQIDINEKQDNVNIVINQDECEKNTLKSNDFLRSIHIEIANACNERCVHCYIPHKYKTDIMDSTLFYRIIEEGRKMNIIHVTLSGGEPLLHKDFISF